MNILDKKVTKKQFLILIFTSGFFIILSSVVKASSLGYIFRRTDRTTFDVDMIAPIGTVKMYTGNPSASPKGWLVCDGSEVSRTTYSDLFNVMGVKYGNGNGSTTFNLPNLVQKVPRGTNNLACVGLTGGGTHTHTAGNHNHTYDDGWTGCEVGVSCILCEVDEGSDFVVQANSDICSPDQHRHCIAGSTGYSNPTTSAVESWQSYQKFIWIIKY